MYFWSRGPVVNINQTELEREIGVSVSSIVDWQNFLRDIAGEFCNQNDRMIGGEGVEVEMDETCVSRRKYNRGRIVKHKQWLVGGVQRNSLGKKCFVEMVADRKRPTLERIIRRRVKPGSIILTDQWKPYFSIEKMGRRYTHKSVNHSKEYVRKDNKKIHTQNIECLWQKLKRRHKTEFGTAETTFESYMNEFVWKQKFGGDDCFFHLISQITNNQKYLCE
uniref:ISXO2-like transposase domain-containing protein n=1 Tax=Meloidogyne enterolobii TaxID=390850 RepID=A0A6V7VRE6_MELEN|nr:unnamed protein product [Meloidogyne enterolobii]